MAVALVHLHGKEFRRVPVKQGSTLWRTVCECLDVPWTNADRAAAISEERDNARRIFCWVDEEAGVKQPPAAASGTTCYATEFVYDEFGTGLFPLIGWDYASVVLARLGSRDEAREFTAAELAGLERKWLRLLRDVERSEAYSVKEEAAHAAGLPLPVEPEYPRDALDESVSELSRHLDDGSDSSSSEHDDDDNNDDDADGESI